MAIPTAIQVEALDIDNDNFDADVAYENLRAHLQRYGTLVVPEEDREDLKRAIARIRDISTGLTHDFATLLTHAAFSDEIDVREFWMTSSTNRGASLRSTVITKESLMRDWGDAGVLVLLDDVSFAVVGEHEKRSAWLDSRRQIEEVAPLARLTVSSTCREATKNLHTRSLTSDADLQEFLGKPLELTLRGASRLILSDRYLAKNCLGDQKRIAALRAFCDAVDTHATKHQTPTSIALITLGHANYGNEATAQHLIDAIMNVSTTSLKTINSIEAVVATSEALIDHDRYIRAGRCGFFLGHGADTLALMPERGKSAAYFSDLATFRNLRKREQKLQKQSEKDADTVVWISKDPRDGH